MECNTYLTLEREATGKFVERKSSFFSFALPIRSVGEAENLIKQYKKKYYNARHICYAYVLETDSSLTKSSDNGEPSGTAGYPILGVLRSFNLTYVLVIVVRYFGGIKLGTSGLAAAYRRASEEALKSAVIVEHVVERKIAFLFPYIQMNSVMKLLKRYKLHVVQSEMNNDCRYVIDVPNKIYTEVIELLYKIDGLKMLEM